MKMKKIPLLLLFGLIVLVSTSCKKDYQCCYLTSEGERLGADDLGCTSGKYSKGEAEDLEAGMIETANTEISGTAKCEEV
jgi:hypothetical protein